MLLHGSLLFLLPITFFSSTRLYAAVVDSSLVMAQQAERERIRNEVTAILDQTLGKGRSQVWKVEIRVFIKGTEKQMAGGVSVGKSEGAGGTRMVGMGQRAQTLPGFPTPLDPKFGNVTPAQDGTSEGRSRTEQTSTTDLPEISRVEKIVASVDKNLAAPSLDAAKKALSDTYAIAAASVKFIPMDFIIATKATLLQGFLSSPGYILASFLLLPFVYFLFKMGSGMGALASAVAIGRSMEATISQTSTEKSEVKPALGEGVQGAGGALGAGRAAAAEIEYKTGEEEMAHKPFAFVKRENLVNLIYLLQEEAPETIAVIIHYLDSELQPEVLNFLSPEVKIQVALTMSSPHLADKADVYAVEKNIRDKISFLIGGRESFIRILDTVDNRTRKDMLDTLEKQSPRLAAKVREDLFLFEDIAALPDLTVQFILREVTVDRLASALRGAGTEKVMAKISSNSSEGFRARLREEMDFGKPLTGQQIEEEQRTIEKTIKEMETKKLIVLKEKVKKGIELEGRLQRLDLGGVSEASGSAKRAQEEFDAGVAAYSSENMAEAINHFQRSVQHDPNRWEAWQYLGTCLYSGGRNDEAFSAYDKALALNPENVQLAEWLAEEKKKRV